MASIICEQCGTRRDQCPANTKLCVRCRGLRDLAHYQAERRTCDIEGCDEQFVPISRHDILCAKCDRSPYVGLCKVCGTEDAELWGPLTAACYRCLKSPKTRVLIIDSLRIKQAERCAQPNGVLPPPPPAEKDLVL